MANMPQEKREAVEREARRVQVGQLLLRGFTYREIGTQVGVSSSTIHSDVKWLREVWREEAGQTQADLKAQEYAELKLIKTRCYEGYLRSQRDEVVETVKTSIGPDGKPVEERTVRRKPQAGDPRYLSLLLETIREESELFMTKDVQLAMADAVGGVALARELSRLAEERGDAINVEIVNNDTIDGIVQSEVEKLEHEGNGNGKPDAETNGNGEA